MNKSTIIEGRVFKWEEETITYENTTLLDEESGKELLFYVKNLFNSVNLPFYLAFGTLLGAVRNGSIIPGDEDLDVFVTDEEKLRRNLFFFRDQGLGLIRVREGQLYSFRISSGAYIDVYILRKLKFSLWSTYCYHLDQYNTPKKYFRSYQNISFLGGDFMCPSNPEALLAFWYGDDWRIPQRGHDFKYEVASAYYWKKGVFSIKTLIMKMIFWDKWKHLVKRAV